MNRAESGTVEAKLRWAMPAAAGRVNDASQGKRLLGR
jgi:hypothetical protein